MNSDVSKLTARIYSAVRPDKEQSARFEKFLENKYGEGVSLEWVESQAFT